MSAESLREIAEVVNGAVAGADPDVRPAGFSIDSRTLGPGDLFFAIVGPRQDGHRYAAEALAKGAAGAVVSDPSALPPGAAGVLVKDTTRALQDLAARRRARLAPKVIGITGTAGKTTTKEMTRQVLDGTFEVLASRGNLHNLYGLPLSLLDLEARHQVAVLEMGMSSRGELARLAEIADPDVGILTNLHGAHLEFFRDLDDYVAAKAELFEGMRPGTIGVFNADCERSRRLAGAFRGYAVSFGLDAAADFRGEAFEPDGLSGCRFTVSHSGRRAPVRLRFAGAHHATNALAAIAAGFMLGCGLEAMAERIARLEPLAMRGRVHRLGRGVLLLDDSYNANPGGVRAALAALAQAGRRRRLVVLGDMLELGPSAPALHREVGRALASSGAAEVFLIGPLSRHTAEAAREAGLDSLRVFETVEEALPEVVRAVRPGDAILVKASRSVGLDRVASALRESLGEESGREGAA
jgi:UDP-N-acetylmuramoyl-tripeptide--D-alanyl-D-alanine ligase